MAILWLYNDIANRRPGDLANMNFEQKSGTIISKHDVKIMQLVCYNKQSETLNIT
jgi:hypothetical protein